MEDCLVTKTAETGMTVDNLDSLPDHDVAENWEKGEDCRESSLSVDHEKWYMVDLETVGKVTDSCSSLVRVRNDDDLVSTIDKFLLE